MLRKIASKQVRAWLSISLGAVLCILQINTSRAADEYAMLPIGGNNRQPSAGSSISMDEDQIAIGAPKGKGLVYYLKWKTDKWDPIEVTPPAGARSFGSSVCLRGNFLIVGAPQAKVGDIETAGAAYVYKLPYKKGDLPAFSTESDKLEAEEGWRFGFSVAILRIGEDLVALAGAPGAGTGGAIFAYILNKTTGAGDATKFQRLEHKDWVVESVGADSGAEFGYALALHGKLAVIGSPNAPKSGSTGPSLSRSGGVFLAKWVTDKFEPQSKPGIYPNDSDSIPGKEFGHSVAVWNMGTTENYRFVVGAPRDQAPKQASGKVYFYAYDGTASTLATACKADDATGSENDKGDIMFGNSVSIGNTGNEAYVGAPLRPGSGSRGYVYQFKQNEDGDWKGKLLVEESKAVKAGDKLGYAVAQPRSVQDEGSKVKAVFGAVNKTNRGAAYSFPFK